MQSGITASAELKAAFQSLLASQSERGLLVTITKAPETLAPDKTIAGGSGSFQSDLANISPLISDKVATYILLRDDKNEGKCIGVTYVPDAAPVRQKMLFASTRLTLVRELGSEHFSSTLFATTPDELTAEGWAKHEAHGSLAAPLTEEERNLEGIREAEAQESMGTMTRKATSGKSLSLPMDDELQTALQSLNKGELGLVQIQIDLATETLKLASTAASCTPDALASQISSSAPRYSVYAHSTPDGSRRLLFLYTCPPTSSIKERMIYAASSRVMYAKVLPDLGLDVSGRLEAGEPDEVTGEEVLEELGIGAAAAQAEGGGSTGATTTTTSTRGGFARPKRPGKR